MVDQLATEYATAGQPVVFLEQDVDAPLGSRRDRWWAAHGGGTVSLPLSMVSSGHSMSYLGSATHDTYEAVVDAELARPAQAEIQVQVEQEGDHMQFEIQVTNLSGVTLSSANAATVHAVVYEEHTPLSVYTDHITHRIVRSAVAQSISTPLVHGATAAFTLHTGVINNVVDWNQLHAVVLVDYRPGGTTGAYDMLQAVMADDIVPALTVSKTASPDPVQAGEPLTYTIQVNNTGNVTLHATITDTLPAHVSPSGTFVWTATIDPGETWEDYLDVTVDAGYTGVLINRVQVTTMEGAAGSAQAISGGSTVYLPLARRASP